MPGCLMSMIVRCHSPSRHSPEPIAIELIHTLPSRELAYMYIHFIGFHRISKYIHFI